MKSEYQLKVAEFMKISGQTVNDTNTLITSDEFDFRDSLLREEIKELQYALVDNNRVEILDALCDIKYVNDGTANLTGRETEDLHLCWFWDKEIFKNTQQLFDELQLMNCLDVECINCQVCLLAQSLGFSLETFEEALNRVHLSNMSKFCNDLKTAQSTRDFYSSQGIETYLEGREKVTVVYRKNDGKVLKSINYYPVQLSDLA